MIMNPNFLHPLKQLRTVAEKKVPAPNVGFGAGEIFPDRDTSPSVAPIIKSREKADPTIEAACQH
jgi:hypothetical protein